MTPLSPERQALVVSHLWIAEVAARRATRGAPHVLEDALSAARLALVTAAAAWRGECQFKHWVWWPCIEAAARHSRALRSPIHSPKQFRDTAGMDMDRIVPREPSCEMPDPGLERILERMRRALATRAGRGRRATVSVDQTLDIYIRTALGLEVGAFSPKQIEHALTRARWAAMEVTGVGE